MAGGGRVQSCVYKTVLSCFVMRKIIVGAALVSAPFLALAQSDPTAQLTGVITTDWPLVLAAGVLVMVGTIAMAIIKKFRKVT